MRRDTGHAERFGASEKTCKHSPSIFNRPLGLEQLVRPCNHIDESNHMNNHTAGPWQVGPVFDNNGSLEVIIEHMTQHGNLAVAVVLPGLAGQHKNAHLIAAAPELLQALRDVVDVMTGRIDGEAVAMFNALAAIRKAEGA